MNSYWYFAKQKKINLALFFIAYQILWCIALPFFVLVILYRHFMLGKACDLKERCGWVPLPNQTQKKVIWLHAVSVGEILSLEYVIKQIKATHPDACCYITTGTAGGKKMALAHLQADYISYLPFDFIICIWLAFTRIRPSALMLIEAELWPNLLMFAHLRGVPIYALNARMSKRSAPRYRRFSFLLRPLLKCITHFYVQHDQDKEKFIAFGIDDRAIDVIGNIKLCNVLEKRKSLGLSRHHHHEIVLLAGSVHPGEAEIILRVFTRLKQTYQHLRLVIVPRHLDWTEQLATHMKATKLTSTLWTSGEHHSISDISPTLLRYDIIAIAKMGILFELYAYADIFFLGGTFVPVGGHNLMEPAVWELATIVGPYHHNSVHEVTALKEREGIAIAQTEEELYSAAGKYIIDTNYRKKIGQQAHQWLIDNAMTTDTVLTNFLNKL